MKNILIVSATSKSNFSLGKKLNTLCKKLGAESKVISLEDYMLPLYTDAVYELQKDNYLKKIEKLTKSFFEANGLIICGPEYNGSTAPIITNTIAWISVSTKNWRDAFNDKISLVATSSGGPGTKFLISMKMQLEHLGSVVMPRTINVSSNNPLNEESAKKILNQFIKFL
tara:strand:- start:397 stop:906 length:510 start_codon:yes stop_codon:yes gene_type:complete